MDGGAFLELHKLGWTYAEIAKRHHLTRSQVAGAIYRTRGHDGVGFRHPEQVQGVLRLAEHLGVARAAHAVGLIPQQVYHWRLIDRAQRPSA